ncbi:MAG: SAM-dependent methyltransferase [Euryarchaeota archaeon]|nr:SAM-dependent methyltransferase [Euryarchaeota archaeon]
MLEMAEVNAEDILYDLGSGDGRIVVEAARKYNAMAVGIEADPFRVIWSKLVIMILRLRGRVKIIWGNLFNHDLSEATVVTVFLWKKTNQRLKPKLQRELKPGTRVVSYVWTFKGWKPVKVDRKAEIYLYVMGQSDQPL